MQKKTLFYIILSILMLESHPVYSSDLHDEEKKPPPPRINHLPPLNLTGVKVLPESEASVSSSGRAFINVLSSPRLKPGESPREWAKLVARMPKQEEATEQPPSLRKKHLFVNCRIRPLQLY